MNFAFPVVAYAVQALRPDLNLHVVVENAGSMIDVHRLCMKASLGIPAAGRRDPMIDAGKWAPFPRKRVFLSSLPWVEPRVWPPRRQAPWDRGWAPRGQGAMPTMLRSRNRGVGPLRASSYQYVPRFLLYKRGTDFDLVPDHLLASCIRDKLPMEHRRPWMALARGVTPSGGEQEADSVASWISQHGEGMGFRVPNVRERGRAMGMAVYLDELGLCETELYDAQGNSFDPQAVLIRVQQGLVAWMNGAELERHVFPGIAVLREEYTKVSAYVQGRGLTGCDHPFPHDLRDYLMASERPTQWSTTPTLATEGGNPAAAEHGRGAQ